MKISLIIFVFLGSISCSTNEGPSQPRKPASIALEPLQLHPYVSLRDPTQNKSTVPLYKLWSDKDHFIIHSTLFQSDSVYIGVEKQGMEN